MDRATEDYINKISSPEDPVLSELYRLTHIRFINPNMVSGHQQGLLLSLITSMLEPRLVLEIGTYTGYSAISIARALPEGSAVITIDENDELEEFCKEYFIKAGVENKIKMLIGRAQDIIPDLKETFDLIFIDGDKREYSSYYRLAKDKLRPGGFILADNVLWGGKLHNPDLSDPQTRGIAEFNNTVSNDKDFEKVILPLRDGIMIIKKKG
jgi:predicted O-methyltransferase YrrM